MDRQRLAKLLPTAIKQPRLPTRSPGPLDVVDRMIANHQKFARGTRERFLDGLKKLDVWFSPANLAGAKNLILAGNVQQFSADHPQSTIKI